MRASMKALIKRCDEIDKKVQEEIAYHCIPPFASPDGTIRICLRKAIVSLKEAQCFLSEAGNA